MSRGIGALLRACKLLSLFWVISLTPLDAQATGIVWKAHPGAFGCSDLTRPCMRDPLIQRLTTPHGDPYSVCNELAPSPTGKLEVRRVNDYLYYCHRGSQWVGGVGQLNYPDIYVYAVCSDYPGIFLVSAPGNRCPEPIQKSLKIIPKPVIIPSESRVVNRRVLTRSELELQAKRGNQAITGTLIPLRSDRGEADTIKTPAPTDANGLATSKVETRQQLGKSVITPLNPGEFDSVTNGVVNWLPATYESDFLVTCYVIALESEAPPAPVTNNVCGIPNRTYPTAFLSAVVRQGTGLARNGEYVHYKGIVNGRRCYNLDTCARTSTNVCATVGSTVAVDPDVIPRNSILHVNILGNRVAQDGGQWINDDHIDDFLGAIPIAQCNALGRRESIIRLLNYPGGQ